MLLLQSQFHLFKENILEHLNNSKNIVKHYKIIKILKLICNKSIKKTARTIVQKIYLTQQTNCTVNL